MGSVAHRWSDYSRPCPRARSESPYQGMLVPCPRTGWAIYWRDRHLKFHEYKRKRPTKNGQALLDHIGTSGDPIFLG